MAETGSKVSLAVGYADIPVMITFPPYLTNYIIRGINCCVFKQIHVFIEVLDILKDRTGTTETRFTLFTLF